MFLQLKGKLSIGDKECTSGEDVIEMVTTVIMSSSFEGKHTGGMLILETE